MDTRDRRDHIELQTSHWVAQMPRLVDAYLDFRLRNPTDNFLREEPIETVEEAVAHPPGTVSGIELIDIFGRL